MQKRTEETCIQATRPVHVAAGLPGYLLLLLLLLRKTVRSNPLSELQELWPGPFSEPTHGAFRKAHSISGEDLKPLWHAACAEYRHTRQWQHERVLP